MSRVWKLGALSALLLCLLPGWAGCGGGPADGDADGDAAADADVEGEGDARADAEADGDGGDDAEVVACPGSEGCEGAGGELEVGAAAVEIPLVIDEDRETQDLDVDGDGEYDPADGDTFHDVDGDGQFDGLWLGGGGNGRAASAVADPLWARAIALRSGETEVVLVAIDCVALFHEDVMAIRAAVADLDLDFVSVAATRTHGAPDTLGIWGPNILTTGLDRNFLNLLRASAAQAVEDAVDDLRPAEVEQVSFELRDAPGGTLRYIADSRDPRIIDDEVRLLRFVRAGTDVTIATLVNLAARLDYSGNANQLVTSDLAHYVRSTLEEGGTGPSGGRLSGLGGVAVFFAGENSSLPGAGEEQCRPGGLRDPLGGCTGACPGALCAETWEGVQLGNDASLGLAEVVGEQLGALSLEALRSEAVRRDPAERLGFRRVDFLIEVENTALQAAFDFGLIPTRETHGLSEAGLPLIRTQVALVELGGTTILMAPGHVDPAMFVGGLAPPYDYTPAGVDIVDADAHAPGHAPDLDEASSYVPLREVALAAGAERVLVFSLANDEIGYFVLPFDFRLDESNPYIIPADGGNHHEETFALGEQAWPAVEARLTELIRWRREGEGP